MAEAANRAIAERLDDDLKSALRSNDSVSKEAIRLMKAALQNKQKEAGKDVDEQGAVEVLSRMARQYRESIDTYASAGRQDLVDREQAELDVLMRYLPEQLDAGAIRALAEQVAAEVSASGPGDKGKLMGKLMPQLRGKADGSVVNRVVEELLNPMGEA